MSSPLKKLALLQNALVDYEAKVAAKQNLIESQQKQIATLLLQNEKLINVRSLHEIQIARKDEQIAKLKTAGEQLESELRAERKLREETLRAFEAEKARTLSECRQKDATVERLQLENDSLMLLNDDFQETNEIKQAEIEKLLNQSNEKLHRAIQNERNRAKQVLENCTAVLVKLQTKVKESNEKTLRVEHVLRKQLDKIDDFQHVLVDQRRAYAEWIDLLNRNSPTSSESGSKTKPTLDDDQKSIMQISTNSQTNESL